MKNFSKAEMKIWYLNAVKSILILHNGLLPDDADKVILSYGLPALLEKCPDAQMHDDPMIVVSEMVEQGLMPY